MTHQLLQGIGAVHPDAVDVAALQRFLVVDERHRLKVRSAEQHRAHARPGVAGAVDRHARDELAVRARVQEQQIAGHVAAAPHIQQRECPVDAKRRERNLLAGHKAVEAGEHQHRKADSRDHCDHRFGSHKADHRAVQAKHREKEQGGGDGDQKVGKGTIQCRIETIEFQGQGRPQRGGNGDRIGRRHNETLGFARECENGFRSRDTQGGGFSGRVSILHATSNMDANRPSL